MSNGPDKSIDLNWWNLSLPGKIKVRKMLVNRLIEITFEEMDRDLSSNTSLDALDEIAIIAYMCELYDRIHEAVSFPKTYRRAETVDDLKRQILLAAKQFPRDTDWFRSLLTLPELDLEESETLLKPDVAGRLESMKRRIGDRFVRHFHNTVATFGITSPVEQIFLMEWRFADVENKNHLSLEPQAPIEISNGTFFLDFLVRSTLSDTEEVRIGVEIDGYEFHEKNLQQATRDKKRERQILHSGIPLLRFSGREIVLDVGGCIKEIIQFIELKRHPK